MPVEIDHPIRQREFFPRIAKRITRISHLAFRSGSEWCECRFMPYLPFGSGSLGLAMANRHRLQVNRHASDFALYLCLQSPPVRPPSLARPKQPPAAATSQETPRDPLMTWGDLLGREARLAHTEPFSGDEGATDIADLWLPDGAGPHPVVLMVHGGCWQKEIADRTLMNWAAEDLRKQGLAVWNIEYRGVDEEGGGYPGTFLEDVAHAADALRDQAGAYNLDLNRVAAFGHSAGGHLALWLAARHAACQ
jgi:acetyl esterase/lipase